MAQTRHNRRSFLQVAASSSVLLTASVLTACGSGTIASATNASSAASSGVAASSATSPATGSTASIAAASVATASSASASAVVTATSSAASVASTPSASAPPAGQTLTLVFWSFFKTTSFAWKTQTQLLQTFNQSHPALKADLQNTTYDVNQFAAAVAAGSPPNVAVLDRYSVAAHAARSLVQDISARASQAGISGDQEQPWAWQEVNFQGKLFGLPDGTDSRALYVNAGHLKQAGLPTTPPKTLQDFSDLVQHLTIKEGTSYRQVGFIPWRDCWGLYGWGWLFGGQFYDAQANRATLDHPQVIAALDWIGTETKTLDYQAVEDLVKAHASNTNPFMDEVLSTYFGASNFTPVLAMQGLAPTKPSLDWTVWPAPPPTGVANTSSWSGGFCKVLPSGATHPDESFALMQYLSDANYQSTDMKSSLELPTIKALAQDPFWKTVDQRYTTFLNVLPYSHSRPPVPQIDVLTKGLNDARTAVVTGKQTAKDALTQQNQVVNAAIQASRVALAAFNRDDEVAMNFDDVWAF
jgi:multiple sugar transport system substrate-binding protein